MRPEDGLRLALRECLRGVKRKYMIGAVGIRNDGVLVKGHNSKAYNVTAEIHAEARLSKRLTPYSTVYVARVRRDKSIALARPCRSCVLQMIARGVKRCYFTTETGYGYEVFSRRR